jgi:hypothetical protein
VVSYGEGEQIQHREACSTVVRWVDPTVKTVDSMGRWAVLAA